ncbi:MAG: HD domain-containing protein [Thermoguttaceae bacterium]|jgi:[protein-PII] uridylyltransferase
MLRAHVLAAKARLAKGNEDFQRRHRAGASGVEICALASNLRDAVLLELIDASLAELGETDPKGLLSEIALVAHGGYGRRDVAPYSDVDLMVLQRRGAAGRLAPLAQNLLRDVFDVGLVLGHSVRTVSQVCRLARRDSVISTSMIESRLLAGSPALFDRFARRFQQQAWWGSGRLMAAIRKSRFEEKCRYGETVFLLEPNIKRSQGGLRDLQLLRWIGFARYGLREPRELMESGVLGREDLRMLEEAAEFLLRLRNELHFHAGQANDVLNRSEQVRIAEVRCYEPAAGLLPVERFMRDYFRHTSQVSYVVGRFLAKAASHDRLAKLATALFGHRVEDDLRVGPAGMMATRRGLQRLAGNLTAIMRLIDLANLHDVPVAASTWEEIRREARALPGACPDFGHQASLGRSENGTVPFGATYSAEATSPEACRHFLSLLAHPARLGPLLRGLHEAGILERFIPEFARARGLLQFNLYHKYTVDEHCLRAVEFATALGADRGPLGRVYRQVADKSVLHLALLIHDLGKGCLEDHREVGLKIAESTARRLGLSAHDAESLKFLVHKHLRMNHLGFRRDTTDEQLVVRFARLVGTPEILQMLYVLTACDLGAVGPDVWDGWKTEIMTDLYHRTMQQLAGDSPATALDEQFSRRREEIRAWLGPLKEDSWFANHIKSLTAGYLNTTPPQQAAADLRLLHDLSSGDVAALAQYLPETATIQLTVGTVEAVTPGIFHKLTGALTSHGLEIRSAEIHTLPDGLVLDRFWVHDPDFAGPPPQQRLDEINQALARSLRAVGSQSPSFRRTWRIGGQSKTAGPKPRTQVNADNSTSDRYTIIDVFALDRTGLLYAVTRTLFEMELSVWRAKIGTYLDQVVDVFYVTDAQHRKIRDQQRLDQICRRLLEVIEVLEAEG